MNKTIKIVSTLVITLALVVTLSQACFAAGTKYNTIISSVDSEAKTATVDTSAINNSAAKVIKAIRNIGAIAGVIIISILGIKYMMGSVEEKAGYQKSFIPLIVGIIVLVAAASIASAIFSVAS